MNTAVFNDFKKLRDRYHSVTHRNGRVYFSHPSVMGRVTEQLLACKISKLRFGNMMGLGLGPDLDKLYVRYVKRVQTMMGLEVERQGNENLKRGGGVSLEKLRDTKNKKKST